MGYYQVISYLKSGLTIYNTWKIIIIQCMC